MPVDPHDTADEPLIHPGRFSPEDPWGNRRDFGGGGYEPTDAEERYDEEWQPDDRNWGPPPDPDLIPEADIAEEHRPGAILRQQEQWPHHPLQSPHYDDYDHARNDWEAEIGDEPPMHVGAHNPHDERVWTPESGVHPEENALDEGEHFYNRDPELGWGPPHFVGGDPHGAVSIEPPGHAGPTDARLLHPGETGLDYDVIARPSPGHGPKAYDVLKPL